MTRIDPPSPSLAPEEAAALSREYWTWRQRRGFNARRGEFNLLRARFIHQAREAAGFPALWPEDAYPLDSWARIAP